MFQLDIFGYESRFFGYSEHLLEMPCLSGIDNIGDALGAQNLCTVTQGCQIGGRIEIPAVTLLDDHRDLVTFEKDTLCAVALL